MASLLILMGIHILLFLYGSGGLAALYPEFQSWFYYEVAFIIGPVFFIHLQSVLYRKQILNWWDALHLVPIVVFWIEYHDVLLMDTAIRDNYIAENFMNRTMVWNYCLAFQMTLYGIASVVVIYLQRAVILQSKLEHLFFLVITYFTSMTLIVYLTHFATGWRDFEVYYLMNTLFIFGVGYVLYSKPQFLEQIKMKYFTSNLGKSQMKVIVGKINRALNEEQLFLRNSLTITELANSINEKPHHVSQTFSMYVKEGFNDCINKRRIEEAKKMLKDSKLQYYKIEAIAAECGFNNKVTFYNAFSKFANTTPSKFRKLEKSKH